MRRWLLPAALAVLIVGVVLTLAGNYGRRLVHDQLAPQKITFAPYDESGQNGDNYEAYPQLRDRAGTTVTDGLAARDFASYINAHVLEATGGKSYSEVSGPPAPTPTTRNCRRRAGRPWTGSCWRPSCGTPTAGGCWPRWPSSPASP